MCGCECWCWCGVCIYKYINTRAYHVSLILSYCSIRFIVSAVNVHVYILYVCLSVRRTTVVRCVFVVDEKYI